jgi:hypothetical protein
LQFGSKIIRFLLNNLKGFLMHSLLFINKGTPDIINLLLLLIGILLCLLALNNFYDWIRTKPWNRNKPPINSEQNKTELYDESSEKQQENDNRFKNEMSPARTAT